MTIITKIKVYFIILLLPRFELGSLDYKSSMLTKLHYKSDVVLVFVLQSVQDELGCIYQLISLRRRASF
jgi:hypothetical protein